MTSINLSNKKDLINTFLLVIFYSLCFYAIQFLLFKTGLVPKMPTSDNLLSWDAGWYRSIAVNGYTFNKDAQSNTGFFILFPEVWKITKLGAWGISFLNITIFAFGFSILSSIFRLSFADKLLWLSMPAAFYVFVPYSEALFFFLAAVCCLAIEKDIKWLLWVALFFLSLTRATTIFLLPAFLVMDLVGNDKNNWRRSLRLYAKWHAVPLLAGLTSFVLYQYSVTGIWFAYFIQQSEHWSHKYTLPEFPLRNPTGYSMVWLSALAVFICFLAFLILITKIRDWWVQNHQANKLLILSVGYLSMTLYIMLSFNVPTTVLGVFRYALMNPFFYVFLSNLTRQTYSGRTYVLVFLLTNLVWLFFGSAAHIRLLLLFTLNTLLVLIYMAYADKKSNWPLIILTGVNIISQVFFFQQFINNVLVD